MRAFLLWALLVLCGSALTSAELTPTNAWYEIQNATWFSQDYRLAIAHLEFEDELYVFDGAACPLLPDVPNLEASLPWPPSSCTCSHLQGASCGTAVSIASSQFFPNGLPISSGCDDYCALMAEEYELCTGTDDSDVDWQLLQLNVSVLTSQTSQRSYFRYLHTDPTAGFQIEVLPLGGSNFAIFGSQTTTEPTRWDNSLQNTVWFGRLKIIQCPMFVDEFATGTWFFTVEAIVPDLISSAETVISADQVNLAAIKVTLIAGQAESPEFPQPNGCDTRGFDITPSDPSVDLQCLRDGEAAVLTEMSFETFYYYMMVEECSVHSLYLHSPTGDRDIYMSYSPPSSYDDWDVYPLASYEYGDEFYAFNPCIDGREAPFPIYFVVDFVGPYYFVVSSRGVDLSRRVVDWPVAPGVQSALLHAAQVVCDPDVANPDDMTCDTWSTDCRYAWPLFPFANPSAAFPQPTSLNSARPSYLVQSLYLGNGSDSRWPSLSNVHRHAVLLSGPQIESFAADQLNRCAVVFPNGALGNAQRQPVSGRYPFVTRQTTTCNQSAFMQLTDLAHDLYATLATLNPVDDRHIIEYSFALDTIEYSPLWSACKSALTSYVNFSLQVVDIQTSASCNTSDGNAPFDVNPCCSLPGQAYGVCSTVQSTLDLQVPQAVDELAFLDNSTCSDCSYYSLQQLMLVESSSCALQINGVDGDTSVDRIQILRIVDRCLAATMGDVLADGVKCSAATDPLCEEADPPRYLAGDCTTDADCTVAHGNNAMCDRLQMRCLVPSVVQEQRLIQCIVANMSESTRAYTQQLLAADTNNPAYIQPPFPVQSALEQLLWNRTRMFSCGASYEIPIHRRHHWSFEVIEHRCSAYFDICNNLLRTDKERAKDGETCRDYCGNDGAVSFYPTSEQSCLAWSTCNWNINTTDQHDCLFSTPAANGFFCGVCADDTQQSDCLYLSDVTSETDCQQVSEACLLPDGTLTSALSANECEAVGVCDGLCSKPQCVGAPGCENLDIYSCSLCSMSMNSSLSAYCPVPALFQMCGVSLFDTCEDEQACESVGGYCSDATDVEISEYDPGFCRTPFNYEPFGFNPYWKCDNDTFTFYHDFGCNNRAAYNFAYCTAFEGEWHWQATTKDECLALQVCVADVYGRSLGLDHRGNYHSEEQCTQPNEQWKSSFAWTSGKWLRGRMVPVAWQTAYYGSRYAWQSTIDFDQLTSDLLTAADLTSSSELQASSVCRFNRAPQLLGQLTCDCLAPNKDTDQSSFDSCRDQQADPDGTSQIETIGSIFTCQDDLTENATQFYSPPVFIQLPSDAIRAQDVCVYLNVERVASNTLMRSFVPQVPLSFASRPELRTTEVVSNRHNIIVGAIVGDGARFEVLGSYPVNFTLCVLLSRDNLADLYPVYDFATIRRDHEQLLLPLGLNDVYTVVLEPVGAAAQNFLCVDFAAESSASNDATKKTNQFDPNKDYVPIRRIRSQDGKSWRDINSEFSSENLALIYTLAAIYTLLLPIVLVAVLFNPSLLNNLGAPLLALVGALLAIIMRFTYFYMAGAGVFAQGALVNLEFVFIIFPIFLVFAIFALQAIAWTFSLNHVDLAEGFVWLTLGYLAFFLTFALWTALFAGLGPDIGTTCGGLIQPTVDSSARDALNLAFTIYLVVLACLLLLVFIIAPYRLLRQIKAAGGVSWLQVVGQILLRVGPPMLGLVILAVLILVLSVKATQSEYFVFFLLLVGEVLPLLLMFYRLAGSQGASSLSSSGGSRDSMRRRSAGSRSGGTSRQVID